MAGTATLDEQIANGKAKLVGDRKPFEKQSLFLMRMSLPNAMISTSLPLGSFHRSSFVVHVTEQ